MERLCKAMLEQKYLIGSMPLLTQNYTSKTCGGAEAYTSTTMFKKCHEKTSLTSRNAPS